MRMTKNGPGNPVFHEVWNLSDLTLSLGAVSFAAGEALANALDGGLGAAWLRIGRGLERIEFGAAGGPEAHFVREAPPLPPELTALFGALREAGWTGPEPDQATVHRYEPAGGMPWHTDSHAWGGETATLSLDVERPMGFRDGAGRERELPLPPRSILLMRGEPRWRLDHRIPAMPRCGGRRLSVTFRTIAPQGGSPEKELYRMVFPEVEAEQVRDFEVPMRHPELPERMPERSPEHSPERTPVRLPER